MFAGLLFFGALAELPCGARAIEITISPEPNLILDPVAAL
jgi:hypothetical protein